MNSPNRKMDHNDTVTMMLLDRFRYLLPQQLALLAGWLLGALLAIIVPPIKWSKHKNDYYKYYGKYNDYNNGNNNRNGNNNYYQSQTCSWYQFKCRKKQYEYQQQYGSGDNGNGEELPGWYLFIGGQTERDRRRREEMGLGADEGALKFVYSISLIVFLGIVVYGAVVIYKRHPPHGLVVLMLLVVLFSWMNLLLIGQGVLSTDDRDLEDSVYGWYGQWGVLLAYSDFWYMLHGVVFSIVFCVLVFLEKRNKASMEAAEANDVGGRDWDANAESNSANYQIHDGRLA